MKRLGVAAALLVLASAAQAQATDCPASTAGNSAQNAARDVCLQAKDVFQLLAPQLGVSITGGNATLRPGGTLRRIAPFTVEAPAPGPATRYPDFPQLPPPPTTAAPP